VSARVLVIEDNPTNLDLMTYVLQAVGHTVLAAATGEEGMRLALAERPDLILCDIHLPDRNGMEVARLLRRDARLHGVPFVAVTALAMVGDRERILAAGFDGYIAKPIEPEQFIPAIRTILSSKMDGR
jgi:CheY-like chemotaxis protein